MSPVLQNLLWSITEPFGVKRRGNLVEELLEASGSDLLPSDLEPIVFRYRVFHRMLERKRVRTMIILRAPVLEIIEALMIEIYRGYRQSTDGDALLFYRGDGFNPVSVVGRHPDYAFIHIVRDQ